MNGAGKVNTRILGSDERASWDRYVMENPFAIAWHLFEWSDLVESHFETRFFPLVAENSTGIVGILPIYLVKPLLGKPRMISVPHAVAGGILADDPTARKALLEAAIRLGTEHGIPGFTLKQYKVRMEGDLTTDDNYYNRELTLEEGPDAVWDRISEGNRERVLETESDGLELEHPTEDLKSFYKFLLKHHRRKGLPCVSEKWICDLVNLGMYSAAVIRDRDGRIVAGTMVKTFRDTVSLPFTCAAGETLKDHLPAYRLYWELIRKYSQEGFKIYHSGRIPVTEDVDPYRLGWEGTRNNYYYQYYPPKGQITEFSRKRSWKRDLFSSIWRVMPLSVSRLLGPVIIRQFP